MHIPIFFINLSRSTDRLQEMRRQFKHFKVKATRIPAIDGKEGLQKFKIIKSWKCLFTSDKEYATTLSHLKAITAAYSAGCDVALICEDDMRILRLPTLNLLAAAPADWDILQLSVIGAHAKHIYEGRMSYFNAWRPPYTNCGGYVINRRGMIKILYALVPNVLNMNDLEEVSFAKTQYRYQSFPLTGACVADYIIYRLTNTYTVGDISMIENRSFPSTIQTRSSRINSQDRVAAHLTKLYEKHGFWMPW